MTPGEFSPLWAASLLSRSLELSGNVIAGPEVHLVGCLTSKRRVGEIRVVLLDIEPDETLQCTDGVETIQVQPLVLERSPPRLDEGVRVGDDGDDPPRGNP